MGRVYKSITPELRTFIEAQHVFFVATAPSQTSGHVNLSPKGMDTFRVLGLTCVAYLDLTGSGNETAAHLTQNGRITFMFCAFEGKPQILRLYGRGRVARPADPEWDRLATLFPELPGTRHVIVVDLMRVQTSCGFGVPLMEFSQERDALIRWAEAKGEQGMREYRELKNRMSIDGLEAAEGSSLDFGVQGSANATKATDPSRS
jgi:Pyridoxamine 5'-phosphate oxidase